MKKVIKTVICMIAVFMMVAATRLPTHAEYFDKPYTDLPRKETITVDEVTTITLGVGSGEESISNITSTNKKLIAKLYYVGLDRNSGGKWYYIQMYSKKKGIYKVRYTYTDANGVSTNKILKVNVTDESPFVSVKLSGKELSAEHETFISGKKGKLIVKMRKGYKLKKIELEKYEIDNTGNYFAEYVIKKVKNKSKIKIPDIPFSYYFGGEYGRFEKYTEAESHLIITYRDKYSKREKTATYTIFKRLN